MQVILLERVAKLGQMGDVVDVKSGYARNFLLPFGKAVPLTPAVMKQVEHRRAKEAERQAALKQEALDFRTALDTIGRFTVKKQTGGDDVLFTFDNPIPSGGPLVFLVEEFDGLENFRVLLPTRPNGNIGWVRGTDVLLTRHNYEIQVRLDDFLLVLSERGVPIFETTVGVAREDAPTPLGRYYTTELLRPPPPNSVYGTYAYGLSGYSEVLTEFAGGEGQLGIHGTNDPSSLGSNVSSGCIRLHNDDISLLVEQIGLPLGVPVEVI